MINFEYAWYCLISIGVFLMLSKVLGQVVKSTKPRDNYSDAEAVADFLILAAWVASIGCIAHWGGMALRGLA